ncbi:MAG: His/Gly/Thr/Pro-type tRNA ligase C-terminal domain-containing protein, partial [bacterium]|nr:His/Gly/Thr/Pro-type tRNA ligase C-terminal domain-containing protein [bacterium]
IFALGTKYSEPMKAHFVDKNGSKKPIIMGCYGIGLGRVMGTAVEVHHDEKGIIWPEEIAPFKAHLVILDAKDNKKIKDTAEAIYQDLQAKGVAVLYDEREGKTAGEKFADADLIGIPYRVVISKKTFAENKIELKNRSENKTQLVSKDELIKYVG